MSFHMLVITGSVGDGLTVLVTVIEFGVSVTEEARSHAVSNNLRPT